MEILQLRYFLKVAELESISKAAEEMHIVQSAMSRSIKRLEEELGTSLFDRKGRGIILNNQGRIAYKRALEVLAAIDRLKKDVEPDQITIRLSIEAGSALMPGLLSEYKALYPDTEFIMNQQRDALDYDIKMTSVPVEATIDEGESIFTEQVKLLVDKKWASALEYHEENKDLRLINIGQLAGKTFIGLKKGTKLRSMLDALDKKYKLGMNYVFESDNPSMIRSMINSDLGLVFFPEKTWGRYDKAKFTLLEIEEPLLTRKIVMHKRSESARVDAFYQYMKKKLLEL